MVWTKQVESVVVEDEGDEKMEVEPTRKRKAEEEDGSDEEDGSGESSSGEDDDEDGSSSDDSDSDEDEDHTDARIVRFRNYKPRNEDLAKNVRDTMFFVKEDMKWLEGEIKSLELKCMTKEEDKLNIAPKTPNWDLKRDMTDKLAVLDRLTKKAIVELLEKRKEEEEEESSSSDDDDDDSDSGSGSGSEESSD